MNKMRIKFVFVLLTLCVLSIHAADVRRTKSGIIIIGKGDSVRAVEPFRGLEQRGINYAEAANRYKKTFGNRVNVYCMVIPTAVALYCPEEAQEWTKDEWAAIDNVYSHLRNGVKAIDLAETLKAHAEEDIYARTDHHWAALGAYYAAQQFAEIADVPFADLSTYQRHAIHNYVGTMYRFSKDVAVKNAPEDFVWFVPQNVTYTTSYIKYRLGRNKQVVSESEPTDGNFFYEYEDGNSAAYMTFMHGDLNTTTVKTSTRNGRRLLILKDSYGNALPSFLFHSFEEIHVVDCRYFLRNIARYVNEHAISDILFANNAGHAHAEATYKAYHRYLEQ